MGNFYSLFQLPPGGYTYNLNCQYQDATHLVITSGIARDDLNTTWIAQGSTYAGHSSAGLGINSAINGINGLDKGTIAINTWYAVLVISDSSGFHAPAGLLTLMGTGASYSPTLPLGYDSYALVSYALTDSSAHFLGFVDFGAGVTVTKLWLLPIQVLNAGSSTSPATSIDASLAAIPNSLILVDVAFTPATANDTTTITSLGVTGASPRGISGPVASKVTSVELNDVYLSNTSTFAYQNSASSGSTSLFVQGFTFQL